MKNQKKFFLIMLMPSLLLSLRSHGAELNRASLKKSGAALVLDERGSLEKDLKDKSKFAQGGDVSGGGSAYEAEFKAILNSLINRLDDSFMGLTPFNSEVSAVDVEDLRKIFTQVKVVFTKNNQDLYVIVDGVQKSVDAINHPDTMLIEVNLERWIKMDITRRENLVLHEVFGLLKIERNSYDSSTTVLKALRRIENPQSPEDKCAIDSMGTHAGDDCLMQLYEVKSQYIDSYRNALLEFAEPVKGDTTFTLEYKAKVKAHIEKQRANFYNVARAQCDMEVYSEGNQRAYDRTLCELKFADGILTNLKTYYQEIKELYPSIPQPKPIEGWKG